MKKNHNVVCGVISVCFLVCQIALYFGFDRSSFQYDKAALYVNENILTFLDICQKLDIPLVLVDADILKNFINTELKNQQRRRYSHNRCEIFCQKQLLVTFYVKSTTIDEKDLQEFLNSLGHAEFDVTIDRGFDKREESLERRHGRKDLVYHLFLTKGATVIHLVFGYERLGSLWSNKCNEDVVSLVDTLDQLKYSNYCKHENVFHNLYTTSATIDNWKVSIPQYALEFLNNLKNKHFQPCHFQQARQFFSENGYDASVESDQFREKAIHMLIKVSKILETLKIPFWLSSGTCLGWFRQCDFIPHSKDVDIGIWIEHYQSNLINAFRNEGFILKHKFGKIEDSFELSFLLDDLKLDLFFFYEDEKYMWNGGTQVKTGKKFKYLFEKFSLCWTLLKDLYVRVPCNTKSYILSNYGQNWNKLIKNWDWKASPSNVHENGVWPEEERMDVIQTFN